MLLIELDYAWNVRTNQINPICETVIVIVRKCNFYTFAKNGSKELGKGSKKKIMENSILGGGGGVSEGHFPYPIFFIFFLLQMV